MISKVESKLSVKEAIRMAWLSCTQVELRPVFEKAPNYHVSGNKEVVSGKANDLYDKGTPYDDCPVLSFHGGYRGVLVITYCEN